MSKITNCDYCGDEVDPVNRWPGEAVVCGKPECNRYQRDCAEQARDEAHEQLDRDMGWY